LAETCLCISGIPSFLTTNTVGIAMVTIAGNAAATAGVIDLINAASNKAVCTYSDHASAQCSASNLCGVSCTDGYMLDSSSRTCTCSFPNVVCNGVCQSSSLCPSSMPPAKREQARSRSPHCKFGHTACGILGGAPWAYECIDTRLDLESCGGCTTPLTKNSPIGTDCSSLPGALDVSCNRGSCFVLRCDAGFTVSSDRSSCVLESPSNLSHVVELQDSGKYWKGRQLERKSA
ncbi:hypothetical protein OE88DRAFT_1630100, partial [Heliocybe sulcata]